MEPTGKPAEALQQMPHSLDFLIQASDINTLSDDGSFVSRVFVQNFWVQNKVSVVLVVTHLSWSVMQSQNCCASLCVCSCVVLSHFTSFYVKLTHRVIFITCHSHDISLSCRAAKQTDCSLSAVISRSLPHQMHVCDFCPADNHKPVINKPNTTGGSEQSASKTSTVQ